MQSHTGSIHRASQRYDKKNNRAQTGDSSKQHDSMQAQHPHPQQVPTLQSHGSGRAGGWLLLGRLRLQVQCGEAVVRDALLLCLQVHMSL